MAKNTCMNKSPIKVKLLKHTIFNGEHRYMVKSITGAITAQTQTYQGSKSTHHSLRVGEWASEEVADALAKTKTYQVTVEAMK